ncbi:unannotated protein [freshwater metagenome]|uniref:Unannotated protein n=1 Tax=freshwater metagenome TaxID=449393 RepID=A0A6J5YAP5_9ZZZZ
MRDRRALMGAVGRTGEQEPPVRHLEERRENIDGDRSRHPCENQPNHGDQCQQQRRGRPQASEPPSEERPEVDGSIPGDLAKHPSGYDKTREGKEDREANKSTRKELRPQMEDQNGDEREPSKPIKSLESR